MSNFIILLFSVLVLNFGNSIVFESFGQSVDLNNNPDDVYSSDNESEDPNNNLDESCLSQVSENKCPEMLTSSKVQICKTDTPIRQKIPKIPVGVSSFQNLITRSRYWSDKSYLIDIILSSAIQVGVITCPRGKGKSINLQMISTFVEIPLSENGEKLPLESSFAFKYFVNGTVTCEDTSIDMKVIPPPMISNSEYFIKYYLGKYPVIYLDFADITVDNNLIGLKRIITNIYKKHEYVLALYSGKIENARKRGNVDYKSETTYRDYCKIVSSEFGREELKGSISFLSRVLYEYHGKQAMIFIDDYDKFINQLISPQCKIDGLNVGELLEFYRSFLINTFRKNKFFKRGVLTGIIEIADYENVWSFELGRRS